jgi:hypothetical protein
VYHPRRWAHTGPEPGQERSRRTIA